MFEFVRIVILPTILILSLASSFSFEETDGLSAFLFGVFIGLVVYKVFLND